MLTLHEPPLGFIDRHGQVMCRAQDFRGALADNDAWRLVEITPAVLRAVLETGLDPWAEQQHRRC
ncbi:hypothetical protein [Mycobacterium florentinum]|uniref:hypothetical protein n=1 Tax=Mycobacterium florentinum TaxID=292462 RepID=UPI00111C12A3|nr:hypothetical protein [Mycobacterium florentinum]MCV7408639.1 hypothetical protein [Mycobacterium florentinum]